MALTGQSWGEAIKNAGLAYGTNPALLQAINKYEQSGTSNFVVNDWDSNAAKGTPSGGPFQFIKPTFDAFARQAREANPAAWRGVRYDWRDPQAQALAASWAFANGKGSHWATYQKALGDVGGKTKGATGVASAVRSGAATGASQGTSGGDGRKAAALNLIFDGDPMFAMAASRGDDVGSDPMPAPAQASGGPGVKVLPRGKNEPAYKYLQRLGNTMFGLRNDAGDSQTTGGRHAPNSWHYQGTAIDWGTAKNTPDQLASWDRFVQANKKQLGVVEHLNEGDHYHTALARSIRGGKGRPS